MAKSGFRTGSRLGDFGPFRNPRYGGFREGPRSAVTASFQDEPVGAVAEPVDGGHPQHAVGREDVSPFTEIEVAISYLELGLVLVCAGALQQGEETHSHRLRPD